MFYIEDGTLISATYFGSRSQGGWFSLFEPGVVFNYVGGGSGIDSYEFWLKLNDLVTIVDGEHKYSTSLDRDWFITSSVEPADYPNANNIYQLRNFLPGTFRVYMQENLGNEFEQFGDQQITLEPGKQYCLEYNCETKEMKLVPGELRTRINTLVDAVNKPFEPFNYSKELKPVSKYPLLNK